MSIGSHQPLTFSHTASGYEQLRSNGEGFALRHEWSATGLLAVQALDGVNGVLERRYQYDVLDRLTGIRDSCKYPAKPNHSLLEIFRHTEYVP
ncbi:hypothetical protein OHJ28_07235 [Dickeya fangzhongdai]